MSLKIAGRLFAGPFPVEKTVVRKNHQPAVYAVISREGKPWNPVFRLLEVGETGEDGIVFAEHAARPQWEEQAKAGQGAVGIYLYDMARSQCDAAARQAQVEEIRARYTPPTGIIPITGM